MPGRPGFQFSAAEVFATCRRLIYPPCKRRSDSIHLANQLAQDLGYVGDAGCLLALKTNQAFQLGAQDSFSSLDFCLMDTVEDHVFAICTKLARMGRLATGGVRTSGSR